MLFMNNMLFTGAFMGLYHMNSTCVQVWLIVQLHVYICSYLVIPLKHPLIDLIVH